MNNQRRRYKKTIDQMQEDRRKKKAMAIVSKIESLMEQLDALGVKAKFDANYYPRHTKDKLVGFIGRDV